LLDKLTELLPKGDIDILQIIERHDDAHNIWNRGFRRGDWEKAEMELNKLTESLNYPYLFATFYQTDSFTGDKTPDGYEWFLKIFNEE
jgi:hypothetical protein